MKNKLNKLSEYTNLILLSMLLLQPNAMGAGTFADAKKSDKFAKAKKEIVEKENELNAKNDENTVLYGESLTTEEFNLLAAAVQAEAGNQDEKGKRLVCAVILNRVDSNKFPNDIKSVLSQKNQFSTWPRQIQNQLTKLRPETIEAVQKELADRSDNKIVFFRTGHYGCGKQAFKYGAHYFSR